MARYTATHLQEDGVEVFERLPRWSEGAVHVLQPCPQLPLGVMQRLVQTSHGVQLPFDLGEHSGGTAHEQKRRGGGGLERLEHSTQTRHSLCPTEFVNHGTAKMYINLQLRPPDLNDP